jgi:hypothetical protein
MAPLQRELSGLEVEPLEIVEQALGREGFIPAQESNLETLSAQGDVGVAAVLTGPVPVNDKHNCCCCCCPSCCC